MDRKQIIRKKYFEKRKKNYFELNENFFSLYKLLKKKIKMKNSVFQFITQILK